MMEERLGAAPYFAGDEFTAADIMMLFPLTTMRAFAPRDLGGFPNIPRLSDAHRRAPGLSAGDGGGRSGPGRRISHDSGPISARGIGHVNNRKDLEQPRH